MKKIKKQSILLKNCPLEDLENTLYSLIMEKNQIIDKSPSLVVASKHPISAYIEAEIKSTEEQFPEK